MNIILLHGFCETKEMWNDFEQKIPNKYNTFALNLPGFGDFHFDITNLTLSEIADIVQTRINALALKDYVLVGHSLGGYIALELAKNYPAKVKGMVLFHSTALPDSDERKQKRNDVINFIKKYGSEKFVTSFIPQLFIAEKREASKNHIEKLIQFGSKINSITLIAITKAMQNRQNNTSTLKKSDFPFHFIIGKNDASIPLDSMLNQIHLPKKSSSLILDECGHMGMFEQENNTLMSLLHFVKSCYS